MTFHPQTYEDYERIQDGLPNFPNYWVETPQDHQHRPTYEQLAYDAYEHQERLRAQHLARHQDYHQGSDMEAMNAALSGPQGWMLHHQGGGAHALEAPIRRLVDQKRAEAERVRNMANHRMLVCLHGLWIVLTSFL